MNIKDAYQEEGYDFEGTINFDKKNGYRSKSFLTVPLKNHENEIIGVMQLINAQNEHGDVISFASKDVVIPDLGARKFSWDESHIGNVCVSTDGSISIYRKNKPGSALEHLVPTLFPKLSRKLSALSELGSDNLVKKLVSWFLKKKCNNRTEFVFIK